MLDGDGFLCLRDNDILVQRIGGVVTEMEFQYKQ